MKKRRKPKNPDRIYKTVFLIIGVLVLAALIVSVVQTTTLRDYISGGAVSKDRYYQYSEIYYEATDTDGGDFPKIAGICTAGDGFKYNDECLLDGKLKEYYPSENVESLCEFKVYDCECVVEFSYEDIYGVTKEVGACKV